MSKHWTSLPYCKEFWLAKDDNHEVVATVSLSRDDWPSYKTSDGAVFKTVEEAKSHCESLFSS